MINYKKIQWIAQAACRFVACDYGFEKNLASSKIAEWIQSLGGYLDEGKDDLLSPIHFGSNAYLDNNESRYRGYIHELLQNAHSLYGPMASFQELADLINIKYAMLGEYRLTISVSWKQVATRLKQ